MASAGRILIVPKGNWDSGTEYEMLDLVFHNDASWIATKPSIDIAPGDGVDEWQKMCSNIGMDALRENFTILDDKINQLTEKLEELEGKVNEHI